MKRILTALVLTPFFFWVTLFAPSALFLVVISIVGALCYYEYAGIAQRHLSDPVPLQANPIPYAAGLVLMLLPEGHLPFLCLVAVLLMVNSLRADSLTNCLPVAAYAFLGVMYTFGAWRCGVGLRAISPYWLLFALASNWIGDTCAYYVGRAIGKHKLAPRVSPGKSWEGTMASMVGAALFGGVFLGKLVPGYPLVTAIVLSIICNVAGQLGDLCESAFKRGAGVKDSGTLLPGHGGWLDRVDSSLFSVPVVYWLLQQPWFRP